MASNLYSLTLSINPARPVSGFVVFETKVRLFPQSRSGLSFGNVRFCVNAIRLPSNLLSKRSKCLKSEHGSKSRQTRLRQGMIFGMVPSNVGSKFLVFLVGPL